MNRVIFGLFKISPYPDRRGGGGAKTPDLTLDGYNFFKIQPNAAKFEIFSTIYLARSCVKHLTSPWQRHLDRHVFPNFKFRVSQNKNNFSAIDTLISSTL